MTHFIFDCDDVLLDWQSGFTVYLRSMGFNPDPAGPAHWDLGAWIGCTQEKAKQLVLAFNTSPWFSILPAKPGAKRLAWDLAKAGHRLTVLSACGEERRIRYGRHHNLHMEFTPPQYSQPLLPFENVTLLPLGESKFDHLYALSRDTTTPLVLIEDNFAHAKSGVVNGITSYCIRMRHNRDDERMNPGTQVIWIDGLSEIARLYLGQRMSA